MSDEKTPLIPRFDATHTTPELAPRRQRWPARTTALKVLGATAAAGILYYNIPEGISDDLHAFRTQLIVLYSHSAFC